MRNENIREVVQEMRDLGLLEYGVHIPAKKFRSFFGLDYPKTATRAEYVALELEELSISGYIRDRLLNEGKYFKSGQDGYRVLLPSENAAQVLSYMSQADNKLKRGIKLNKNTPPSYKINNQDEVRMIMKRENVKVQK